jgi:hypothetical protein
LFGHITKYPNPGGLKLYIVNGANGLVNTQK